MPPDPLERETDRIVKVMQGQLRDSAPDLDPEGSIVASLIRSCAAQFARVTLAIEEEHALAIRWRPYGENIDWEVGRVAG